MRRGISSGGEYGTGISHGVAYNVLDAGIGYLGYCVLCVSLLEASLGWRFIKYSDEIGAKKSQLAPKHPGLGTHPSEYFMNRQAGQLRLDTVLS